VVASRALYPFLARENAPSGLKVVVLFAFAGVLAAAIGVFVAPFVVPLLFGSAYQPAVPVVQIMILVVPFVFVSNPLLVHLYSSRREGRRLTIVLALVALTGTAVIVLGQLLIGTTAAAAGYVVRSALFVAVLLITALAPAHDQLTDEAIAGVSPATRGLS
jgi:O-antigen/teichoic acid export membrane protein